MKAQHYLQQIRKLDLMIANKLAEREQWLNIATGITAKMGGDRVQASGSQQKMADAVDKYIDIEAEIDATVDKLVDTKRDVIGVIEQLNATEYDLLHKIYVQYKTFGELAVEYDKSYSWITTVHGRALKNVQNIIDAREN